MEKTGWRTWYIGRYVNHLSEVLFVHCQRLFSEPLNQHIADAGIPIDAETLEELLEEMRMQLAQEGDIAEMFF